MKKPRKSYYWRKKYSKYGNFHIYGDFHVEDLVKLKGSPSTDRDNITVHRGARLIVPAPVWTLNP